MNSNNILKNKNCLVTGATAGIGKAIALELASKGCNLFITGRNSKRLENLKKTIEEQNKNLKIVICAADLSKRSEIQKMIKKVRINFSNIDILVNSAGIFPVKLLKDTEIEDFDTCFNVNIITPFLLSQEFSKEMKKNNWGRIINIASSAAYSGRARGSMYRATKHALLGFSKAITKELRDNHVRVFCISPGPTKTKMGKIIVKKDNPNEDFDTFIEPSDIAEYISHLISFNTELFIQEIRLGRIIGEK